MAAKKEATVGFVGTLNAQNFYNALARIISERENVNITVKVTKKTKKQEEKVS